MDTETIISHFIKAQVLGPNDERVLERDAALVSTGILDSVSVLKLLVFIEERFSVSIADEELTPAHFETIGSIASFIDGKTKAATV
jgi:acyl carrier protein